MIKKIMIMLGKPAEGQPQIKDGYASFASEVQNSGNKTEPKIEEHQMLAKIAKKLRETGCEQSMPVSEHDHNDCDCVQCRAPDSILSKIVKRFYG